jgi:hypothetical protein
VGSADAWSRAGEGLQVVEDKMVKALCSAGWGCHTFSKATDSTKIDAPGGDSSRMS